MTSKWESYRLHCRKYQTVPRTRVPFFDFFLIHNTHESWRMSNQELANSRVLRNSIITSLSPFPFKSCSERIIDFHFLSSHKFSDKILAAISLRCIGCWQTAKQTSRQIEFSDAFKTKIGSFPVGAAIISHFSSLCSISPPFRHYFALFHFFARRACQWGKEGVRLLSSKGGKPMHVI